MNLLTVLRLSPNRSLAQSLLVGSLSVLGLTSAMVLSEVVHAQAPGDMTQYTRVARQIEQQRMQDYAEVKQIMGGTVPENVCQRRDTPQKVQDICGRFENTSRDIITRNGMSVTKFNEITRYCQQNPKPKECPR